MTFTFPVSSIVHDQCSRPRGAERQRVTDTMRYVSRIAVQEQRRDPRTAKWIPRAVEFDTVASFDPALFGSRADLGGPVPVRVTHRIVNEPVRNRHAELDYSRANLIWRAP